MFNIGDKVRVGEKSYVLKQKQGVVRSVYAGGHDVEFSNLDSGHAGFGRVPGHVKNNLWWFDASDLEKVAPSSPSVAADLTLTPQAKTVLRHLKRHDHISNAEADRVYSITRLAACIYEIRKIGYDVKTTVKRDDVGHKYSNYKLATVH